MSGTAGFLVGVLYTLIAFGCAHYADAEEERRSGKPFSWQLKLIGFCVLPALVLAFGLT